MTTQIAVCLGPCLPPEVYQSPKYINVYVLRCWTSHIIILIHSDVHDSLEYGSQCNCIYGSLSAKFMGCHSCVEPAPARPALDRIGWDLIVVT